MERDDALERWPTIRERAGRRGEIDAAMEAWTSTRPVREVEAAFLGDRLPGGPGARSDRGRRRRRGCGRAGCCSELRHPSAPADRPSGFLGASLPISFEGRVELPPAELLGTSTDAVLRELAGCDDDELARLRADGVIA